MSGISADVLGVIIIAVAAAAILYALRHAAAKFGRPLPKSVLPFGIAAAMIGYTVWSDYSWFSRIEARLPDRVEVLGTGGGGSALRPWAWAVPSVQRFTALDRDSIEPGAEGSARAQVLLVERRAATRMLTIEVDCAGGRQRLLAGDGSAQDWGEIGADDPLLAAVCGEPAGG